MNRIIINSMKEASETVNTLSSLPMGMLKDLEVEFIPINTNTYWKFHSRYEDFVKTNYLTHNLYSFLLEMCTSHTIISASALVAVCDAVKYTTTFA